MTTSYLIQAQMLIHTLLYSILYSILLPITYHQFQTFFWLYGSPSDVDEGRNSEEIVPVEVDLAARILHAGMQHR